MGKILVTGASGLIGKALIPLLISRGHSIARLVRSSAPVQSPDIRWNPETGELDPRTLEGAEAVIHLAGETISERWTVVKKLRIRNSRVIGTRLLAERLIQTIDPPKVLLSSSAIGFYGDRGSEALSEDSPCGTGFLSEVCREWEQATIPAEKAGIRVVHLRTGIVLSRGGGALAKMLPAFRLGVAGRLGAGKQFMSWIGIDDLAAIFLYALANSRLHGPVNAVAPTPVTNAEFTRTLGDILHRPTFLPVPAFAIRILLGEMGEQLLLSGSRVIPAKLLEFGYEYRHPTLEAALRHVLGASNR